MNTYPTDEQAAQMAADMTYPVVVYGTLRPGFGNDRLWQQRARAIHDGTVYVAGYRLTGRGFPYAIPSAEGETIVGALIVPEPWTYDAVLADMDSLEGVPHHYTRELVTAETPDGYRVAWMYVAAADYGRGSSPVRRDRQGRYDWALGTETAVNTGGTHRWRRWGPDVEDVECANCGADMTDRAAAQRCPGQH